MCIYTRTLSGLAGDFVILRFHALRTASNAEILPEYAVVLLIFAPHILHSILEDRGLINCFAVPPQNGQGNNSVMIHHFS
jgi:hypothetical protein